MNGSKLIGIGLAALVAAVGWGQGAEHSASYKERSDAAVMLAAGKNAEARAAYQAILIKHKDLPVTTKAVMASRIALSYQREKNLAKARTEYEKLIKDYPDADPAILASATVSLGACLRDNGKLDEALAAWANPPGKSKEATGRLLNVLVAVEQNAAGALSQKGDSVGALARLAAIPSEYPLLTSNLTARIEYQRGTILVKAKRYNEALGAYERALADPAHYGAANAGIYSMCHPAYINDPVKRAEAWEKVLKGYPKQASLAQVQAVMRDGAHPVAVSEAVRTGIYMDFVKANIRELGCAPGGPIARMIDVINPTVATTEAYVAYLDEALRTAHTTTQNVEYLSKMKDELNRLN